MNRIPCARKLLLWLAILTFMACGTNTQKNPQIERPPLSSEVAIFEHTIRIPIGYFLLARRHSERCAVKLIDHWTTEGGSELYTIYDSYFSKHPVAFISPTAANYFRGELSFPKLVGIGRLAFNFGELDIRCGSMQMHWTGVSWIYFHHSGHALGDYGIELAPTPWTDIAEVNFNDPRLQWYRYDENREESYVHIDQLWEKDPARDPDP